MKYLIKNCTIVQKGSNLHLKKKDILIDKGIIVNIGKGIIDAKAQIIKSKNLHVSVGWMDIGVHLGEPGYEQRETFDSLAKSAFSGGYTDIVTMPLSMPTIQTKAQLKNIIDQGKNNGLDIHPLGALSQDMDGENITEFVDMDNGGAVGFTDGLSPIKEAGLLMRALQYVKRFDGLVLHHPNDKSLSNGDLIHEGIVSTSMGMKGSPSMAEELMLNRDLKIQEYTDSRLCVHLISTKGAIDILKKCKKDNQKLSTGVSYLNLIKSDEDMIDFDSHYKVQPILRAKSDQKALRKGVTSDVIDYISSNHYPLEVEKKQLEYAYADHGAIGLETCYAAINTFIKDISTEVIIDKLTTGPRKTMNLPQLKIENGEVAKLTIFDPTIEWKYDTIKSSSNNTPFYNQEFVGKVIGSINGKNAVIV